MANPTLDAVFEQIKNVTNNNPKLLSEAINSMNEASFDTLLENLKLEHSKDLLKNSQDLTPERALVISIKVDDNTTVLKPTAEFENLSNQKNITPQQIKAAEIDFMTTLKNLAGEFSANISIALEIFKFNINRFLDFISSKPRSPALDQLKSDLTATQRDLSAVKPGDGQAVLDILEHRLTQAETVVIGDKTYIYNAEGKLVPESALGDLPTAKPEEPSANEPTTIDQFTQQTQENQFLGSEPTPPANPGIKPGQPSANGPDGPVVGNDNDSEEPDILSQEDFGGGVFGE